MELRLRGCAGGRLGRYSILGGEHGRRKTRFKTDSRTYFDDFKEDESEKSTIDNKLKTDIINNFNGRRNSIDNVDNIIEAIKKCNSETSLIRLFKSFKNDNGIGIIFADAITNKSSFPPPPPSIPGFKQSKLTIGFTIPDTTGSSETPEKPDPSKFSSWEKAYNNCDGKTIYKCDCDPKIYITKEEWKPTTGGFRRFRGGSSDIPKIILIFFISATIILIIVIIICICCNKYKNNLITCINT